MEEVRNEICNLPRRGLKSVCEHNPLIVGAIRPRVYIVLVPHNDRHTGIRKRG